MFKQAKYLIIGSSAAGISAANTISRLDTKADILCVSAENSKPYNKCFLVDWVSGEKTQDQVQLALKDNVQVLQGSKVKALNPSLKSVYLENGAEIQYEKLLLCTGVSANMPPIKGIDQSHVFNFHTFADSQRLINFIDQQKPQKAVVIGAGLTGLECADALMLRGLQVSVVERGDQVLGRHVDIDGAKSIVRSMQNCGVEFYGSQSVVEVASDKIVLASGQELQADLVVFAVGVRPNKIEVVGVDLKYMGSYVQVDHYLQTNLPNVWAAGDMIVVPDILTGKLVPSCTWPDAMMQGALAAQNMLGKERKYPGVLSVANSHFFGKSFISCGNLVGQNIFNSASSGDYKKCILNGQGLVEGFLLIGDTSQYPDLRRSVLTKQAWTC